MSVALCGDLNHLKSLLQLRPVCLGKCNGKTVLENVPIKILWTCLWQGFELIILFVPMMITLSFR